MSNKTKFAVVGVGHIGRRHAQMIINNNEAELVALCDIKQKNALNIDNFNVPFFNSIDDLLNSNIDVDVVNICTPNGLHAEQSIKALEHNKHVVCEKPISLTKASAEKIIFKSLQVSKHVFTVMQNRYSPPSVWLKNVIDNKLLGEIYMVHLNCFWNRDERYYHKGDWHGTKDLDGGTLFTQFSHFIDVMYWLFGDITNINATFKDFSHKGLTEFEDSGIVFFDFIEEGAEPGLNVLSVLGLY